MSIEEKKREQFNTILRDKKIKSVYQPIISLYDGNIFGYEALSRIDLEDCLLNIEEMFRLADRLDEAWCLEEMCRIESLKNVKGKLNGKKLFLNVNPNIINDDKFKKGITYKCLQRYDLNPRDIIFEITERTAIEDLKTFRESVKHYKNQNYQIAIDDVGSGYAGFNRICNCSPDFLKIDISLIRDIDKEPQKRALIESFIMFCEKSGIKLIAEGIENEAEFKTLIKLGVILGQGYYIARPEPFLFHDEEKIKKRIKKVTEKYNKYFYKPSFFGNVGMICKPKNTTQPLVLGKEIFELVKNDPMITEVCVINQEKELLGVLTRRSLLEDFAGRYGFNLHAKKYAVDLMTKDFLVVDTDTSIELVSKMALSRKMSELYDAVIVTKNEKYLGVVTVRDLLEAAINIQVTRAVDSNPLTGLSGNLIIEKEVRECLASDRQFAAIYLDLDNFKAYNDAYGFNNGDLMIKTVANCIKEYCSNNELMGHIGGDDFIIITDYWQIEDLCQSIINKFSTSIKNLYSYEDWEKGYIISKDRNGFEDKFPIASLSISALTNRRKIYDSLDDFSKEIALLKKQCKQIRGNCFLVV